MQKMSAFFFHHGGSSKQSPVAKAPSRQGVESSEDMVWDPAISNFENIGSAQDEGNAEQRVDAAVPSQECAGMQVPQPENMNFLHMFNDIFDNYSRQGFANFSTWLQISPTHQISGSASYRAGGVIDIIQFLENTKTEILSEFSTRIINVEGIVRERHQSGINFLVQQHQQQEELSKGKIQELSSSLQETQAALESKTEMYATAKSNLQDREEKIQVIQGELLKEKKRISDLTKSQESSAKQVKENYESKLREKEETAHAKDLEAQRLGSIIQQQGGALRDVHSAKDHVTSENEKLRSQIAVLEKKSAQDSLTSGSYTEGRANPSMLVTAAQNVDKATDELAKFLYNNSLMSGASLKDPNLEILIGIISRASPGDFTRPAHMKHVWGHWISGRMFQGFEHVYFDVPEDQTSPLDMEKHASDCFQTYQQKKDVPSLEYYTECDLFRAFCTKMFPLVFSTGVVADAGLEDSAKSRKSGGGFGGGWEEPGQLKRLFLDVAKAIWLLHELAFSFQPPASIMRVGWGQPFDSEYQEPVIKDDENKQSMMVVLMLRPGFRVKKSLIKSRVLLSKMLLLNPQASM